MGRPSVGRGRKPHDLRGAGHGVQQAGPGGGSHQPRGAGDARGLAPRRGGGVPRGLPPVRQDPAARPQGPQLQDRPPREGRHCRPHWGRQVQPGGSPVPAGRAHRFDSHRRGGGAAAGAEGPAEQAVHHTAGPAAVHGDAAAEPGPL